MTHPLPRLLRTLALCVTTTSLVACGTTFDRLQRVGQEPAVSPMTNPAEIQPIVTMPMPAPTTQPQRQANSLWRPGARAFLKDSRASQVGDILTVVVNRTDTATFTQEADRTRTNTNTGGTTALLGYESTLWNRLPGPQGAVTPATLLNAASNLANNGTGTMDRNEVLDVRVAAVVTQVLPNGNLVLAGSQEARVNFETRVIKVAGVIRPADITSTNTIDFTRMAEARLSYGGRGQLTDVMQPRWGQQMLDILFPF